MNPELVRNLRLECSPHRLVAMPVVLGLLLAVAGMGGGPGAVVTTASLAIGVLLVLWGSRLAADAVLGEIADRTWDSQRMSAIGPWSMTWGKLFGSTVFVWYGTAICLAAAAIAGPVDDVDRGWLLGHLLAAGLACQAAALFFSLLLSRGRPQRVGLRVTLAQILAIGVSVPFIAGAAARGIDLGSPPILSWYGIEIAVDDFVLATNLLVVAWGIFGCYRLMRVALQCRTSFLGWLAFTVFLAAYCAGLDATSQRFGLDLPGERVLDGWLTAFAVSLALTYAAAFAEPKSIVRLRRWLLDLGRMAFGRAALDTPSWMVSGAVCLVCALNAISLLMGGGNAGVDNPVWLIVAVVLFAVRDIALLYAVTLDHRHNRGHLAAMVYLVVLYVLIPGLLAGMNADTLIAAFLPVPGASPWLGTLPVLVQILVVLGILVSRVQRLGSEAAPSPAAE